jgi:hypothetical protein
MDLEAIAEGAAARLRVAGIPRETAELLAARIAPVLDILRRQAEALPPGTEPATTFTASGSKPPEKERL